MQKYLVVVSEVAYYRIRVAAEDAMAAKEKALRLFYQKPLKPVEYGMPKVAELSPVESFTPNKN